MARTDNLQNFLTDAAAAIRLKSGSSASMSPNEMINNINSWLQENLSNYIVSEVDASVDRGYMPIAKLFFKEFPLSFWNDIRNSSSPKLIFSDLYSLKDFNIKNMPYNNEQFFGMNFSNCWEIKNINLKDFNYRGYLSAYCFDNCESAQIITLPDALNKNFPSSASLLNCYAAFDGCKNLIEIKGLENLDFNNTNMSYLFKDCLSLENFDFLYTWTNLNQISECRSMFYNARHFSNIDIFNNLSFLNCKSISYMFERTNISKLENLILNFPFANAADSMFSWTNITSIDNLNINIYNSDSSAYAFQNCRYLQNVNLGQIDISKTKNMYKMFENCINLTNIMVAGLETLPQWGPINNIGYMFHNCTKLNYISPLLIFNFPWESIKFMGCAFSLVDNLSLGTISAIIQCLPLATNLTYKNLSNRNSYSPFNGTSINFANSDYVTNFLTDGGSITTSDLQALVDAGWGGVCVV